MTEGLFLWVFIQLDQFNYYKIIIKRSTNINIKIATKLIVMFLWILWGIKDFLFNIEKRYRC